MSLTTSNNYDSAFCGNLPIHLINVVQPYGALVVLEKSTYKIIQLSQNLEQLLGKPVDELAGTNFSDYISSEDLETLSGQKAGMKAAETPVPLNLGGTTYLCIIHVKEKYILVEINLDSAKEKDKHSFIDVYQDLKDSISAIENAADIEEAAAITARELKLASGFDKVMIYRFDENWNGHVLAEEMEAGMESYLHFTFPASDIPKQARDLYLRNTYRFIPDREFAPVKLYPVINPASGTFIDLSDCNLRGVSAVHLEYLKNMGVRASMSTRILHGNKLWGLIACHHQTVKLMSYKMCTIFEMLSAIISSKISSLSNNENLVVNNRLKDQYSGIMEDTYRTHDLVNTFLSGNPGLLELFDAGGAVIVQNSVIHKRGTVPSDAELDDLLLWLNAKQVNDVYHTQSLVKQYDTAETYKENASGLLVIPVSPNTGDYILVFRPEVVRVTNWGGDPSTRINFEQDLKTYHPRFSFKLWREQVTGIAIPWKAEEIKIAKQLRDFVQNYISTGKNNN